MKKLLITALVALTVSTSLAYAGAGWWTDDTAPIYDFSTGAIIKTGYATSPMSDKASRMGAISFKVPWIDNLQYDADHVYFVDTKGNKVYLNAFKTKENGVYGTVYTLTPRTEAVIQNNMGISLISRTNCSIYDPIKKAKLCDRISKTEFNTLGRKYKAIGVKLPDGTTKEMKITFSNQETLMNWYQ
jgi:hypothetical protein